MNPSNWNSDDWDYAIKNSKSYASNWVQAEQARTQRERAERYAREQQKNLIREGVLNKDGTPKAPKNPIAKFADGVVGVGKGIVDSTVHAYKETGRAIGTVAAEVTGVAQREREERSEMLRLAQDELQMAIRKSQDQTLAPEERERWGSRREELSARTDQILAENLEQDKKTVEDHDPVKAAGAIASVGLDLVTAGSVGAVARGGRALYQTGRVGAKAVDNAKLVKQAQRSADNPITRQANKIVNPAGLKQSMVSGATLGLGYGVADTAIQEGQDATAGDYLAGGATGAAAGSVLGAGISVLGKVGRSVFAKAKDRSTDTSKVAKDLISEAPEEVVNTPGFTDEVNNMASNSRNVREFKESFNEYLSRNAGAKSADDVAASTEAVADVLETIPEERRLGTGVRTTAEIDEDFARLQSGEDESVYKYTSNEGEDVTDVASQYNSQISEVDSEIRQLKTQKRDLDEQASGANGLPDDADPSAYTGDTEARSKAMERSEAIDGEVAALEARKAEIQSEMDTSFNRVGGVQRMQDPTLVRERAASLRAERSVADAVQDKMYNNSRAVQAELDDLEAGNVPDDLIKDNPPADTVDEAVRRAMKVDPQDQVGLQRTYQENQAWREEAEDELVGLMTTERYEDLVGSLSENYKLKVQEISELPKPLQEEEMALLDADFEGQVVDFRLARDQDAPRVEELEEAILVSDDINNNIMAEWNSMEQSNPNIFGEVDEQAADLYKESLQRKKAELELREPKVQADPVVKSDDVDIALSDAADGTQVKGKLEADDTLLERADELLLDQLDTGRADVNKVDSLLRQPANVLKKLGSGGKALTEVISKALNERRMFNGELQARIKENKWNVAMKPDYRDDFIGFLDKGKPLTRGAHESAAHFENRQAALNDIKAWFRETGKKLDLPEEMLDRNYLPHLIKKESGETPDRIAEAMAALKANKGLDGKELTSTQISEYNRVLKGVSPQTRQYLQSQRLYHVGPNGFLQKRTGATEWSRDPQEIIMAYARAASNELYIKPALKDAQMIAGKYDGKVRRYIDRVVENVRTDGMDGHGKLEQGLSAARRIQNVSLMGASVRTVALQMDGGNRIFREAGLKPFLQSAFNAHMAMKPGSKLQLEAMRAGALEDSFAQSLQSSGGVRGLANKTEKVMYSGITAVDSHFRIMAFDVGKRQYAKSIGKRVNDLSGDDLVRAQQAGVDMANKTQFNMDALTIPVDQNTPAGKFLTQIQQYNLRAGADISQHAWKGVKALGNPIENKDDLMKAARMVVAYGAMMATMTNMANEVFGDEIGDMLNPLGFAPEDLIPFGEQVIQGIELATGERDIEDGIDMPMTPLLSFMFGSSYGDGVTDYISTVAKHRAGEIDDQEFNAVMHSLPSFLVRNILPGGTQFNRSVEGYDAVTSGESVNRSGNTRFMVQNQSGLNLIKGLVGGQYATDEGQEWIRSGMNTISSKHRIKLLDGSDVSVSQYARGLAPSEQAQYIGYYSSKQLAERELAKNDMGRDTVLSSLRSKLLNDEVSLAVAQGEAQVWNDKVRSLYSPYLNGNDRIPSRLIDDFNDSVLIDISSFNNMRDTRLDNLDTDYGYWAEDTR